METSAIAMILTRLAPVRGHASWRRFVVDAQLWTAIAKSLGDGDGDLIGLWGDADAVHMALRTPPADPCVVSLAVAE